MRPFLHAVAFACGFATMGLELLAGRVLAPYFGASVHVWGSIITVFMLSLALGYLAGGWLSLKRPSLRRLALLLGVAATGMVPVLAMSEGILQLSFGVFADPRYGSLIACLLLYALPIACLGAVSPYSVRLLEQRQGRSGHTAGMLYFVATVGSALGTLMTSFYLVLWFDVQVITTGLLLLLIGCGALALWYPIRHRREPGERQDDPTK